MNWPKLKLKYQAKLNKAKLSQLLKYNIYSKADDQ